MGRVTFNDLKLFLQNHNEIKGDSVVFIMDEKEEVSFVYKTGMLNMKGAYDWVQENGESLPRVEGSVLNFENSNKKYKTKMGSTDNKVSFQNIEESGIYGYGRTVNSLKEMMLKTFQMKQGKYGVKDDAILVSSEGDGKFSVINEIKSIERITILSFSESDTFIFSPKKPVLVFVTKESIKQKFNPNPINESNILNFNNFNNFKE